MEKQMIDEEQIRLLNDLISVLEQTVSPDKNELENAQKFLEQTAAQNFLQFQASLATVLANPQNSQVARIAAGLQLKNTLTSKDLSIKMAQQQRWLEIAKETRQVIKNLVLQTLGTETQRPSSAAQCVACIACAEIPSGQWPELIPQLVSNVTAADSTEPLKESTLEAIGYICQDIDPDHLSSQSNDILTAIVQGMRKEEPSIHVKHAATNAMLNSLEFTKANFDKESERDVIMQVVCETTQCQEPQVQVAALQCLVKIMSLYYQHMEKYMGPALFAITLEAMRNETDEIALQGIEFWSNVCDEEMDLAIELSEAQEIGAKPDHYSRHYAKGALQYLVPLLLQTLAKQVHDDSDDDDEWNPCKAAGVCLMLLSNCCEDDVLNFVLPFIKDNIGHGDWRFRDASVMAFGSILEGPDQATLKPLVIQALPKLIELLKDPSVVVRDTVAWTLGRTCEMLPEVVLQDVVLQGSDGQPLTYKFQDLLEALIANLKAEPRVAANVCWAFSSLAEAAFEANISEDEEEPLTYELSEKYEVIVANLLEATMRPDAHQANLRSAAYEAVMEMIKNSAKDCYETVKKTTEVILERINSIIPMESVVTTASERVIYNDLQSLLCATLQSVLRRVRKEDAIIISDQVMGALLQMFDSTSGKSGGVQEDALLAVGTLVEVLGSGFSKYMALFKPFLIIGLKNFAEYQVCLAAVGLVGDICRAMNTEVRPYCDEIMSALIENLGNENVHRSVKPQILSVFGDIALAIGPEFRIYLDIVLGILQQASLTQVDKTDYEMLEYLNELREGCLEAYTGIVQGLKGDSDAETLENGQQKINADLQLVLPHMQHMIHFIEHIATDEDHSDSNVSACAGLVGDLCSAYGNFAAELNERPYIQDILTEGRKSKVNKTRTLATWATKEIRKLKNIAQAAQQAAQQVQ